METKKQDLLTLGDMSRDEIMQLMARAEQLKAGRGSGLASDALSGKSVAMIFEKPSTRTRVSFEVGIMELGGRALYLNSNDMQLKRGEPIRDTARVFSRYVDGIVIRAYSHEDVKELASYAGIPVVNALTDIFHPCQILADLFTLVENGIDLGSVKVAYIGDGNNVANSWIQAAGVLGFDLRLACPESFEPHTDLIESASSRGGRIKVMSDPGQAADGADMLYTDVWVSMGQDDETERRKSAFVGYQINQQLLERASDKALIMHCLPAHRGEEITDQAMEHERSVVFDQAENRLHVQKAVLERLIR